MSSSWLVTVTGLACAVAGLAEGEGAGVEAEVLVVVEAAGVETASCAVAMFVSRNSAPNAIGKFFVDLVFKVVIGLAFAIWAKPGEAAHLHKCEPRFRRSGLTITPRENAAEFVLDPRGRGGLG